MNALFYVAAYHFNNNEWWRFMVTTPDGPHDRHAAVIDKFKDGYSDLGFARVKAEFVCLTPDEVFMEV
jgi:hypothetical protein